MVAGARIGTGEASRHLFTARRQGIPDRFRVTVAAQPEMEVSVSLKQLTDELLWGFALHRGRVQETERSHQRIQVGGVRGAERGRVYRGQQRAARSLLPDQHVDQYAFYRAI